MQLPTESKVVHLAVLLMPNGEVWFNGKTIGWFDDIRLFLSEIKE